MQYMYIIIYNTVSRRFSKNVRPNIGRDFLRLNDKHFPKTRQNLQPKHHLKVSYTVAA